MISNRSNSRDRRGLSLPQRPAARGGWTRRLAVVAMAASALLIAGCGSGGSSASASASSSGTPSARPFTIGAIPDQDPQKLQRLYGTVADYLSSHLHLTVRYRPVTDYTSAVNLFRSGDLDMVWFGGLTGVQARLQVPGAQAIAQRNIDDKFTSYFIVNSSTGIDPVSGLQGLTKLKGLRFTYGSPSSTSGTLMPEYFLDKAGVHNGDFAGQPGFSGSHDKTLALVQAGSFQAGALNSQVWDTRLKAGTINTSKVHIIFRTPAYHDYHWLIRPHLDQYYGSDFTKRVTSALVGIKASDPSGAEVLKLFAATQFVPTNNGNYKQIEAIGRKLGVIT